MLVNVLTIFPDMFKALTDFGITKRAIDNGLLQLNIVNIRKFGLGKHNKVDDRPFGGGPGMVMMMEPMLKALQEAQELSFHLTKKKAKVVFLSPQGRTFNQETAREFLKEESVVFVAGRYEGVDERFIENYTDLEISVGDFVVSGGELPIMIILDAIIRLIPGSLRNEESALTDSYSLNFLDYPNYTHPRDFQGLQVPEVLFGGNHKKIQLWRLKESLKRTLHKKAALLENCSFSGEEKKMLEELKRKI